MNINISCMFLYTIKQICQGKVNLCGMCICSYRRDSVTCITQYVQKSEKIIKLCFIGIAVHLLYQNEKNNIIGFILRFMQPFVQAIVIALFSIFQKRKFSLLHFSKKVYRVIS